MTARIDRQALADLELTLSWTADSVRFTDVFEAHDVNFELEEIEAKLAKALTGLAAGESARIEYGPGELVPAFDPALSLTLPRTAFNEKTLDGCVIGPKRGRWYPAKMIQGLPESVVQGLRPVRIVAVLADSVEVDCNHPLAARPLALSVRVLAVKPGEASFGPVSNFARYFFDTGPGVQAVSEADFAESFAFTRQDQGSDAEFYLKPRMIGHIDRRASAELTEWYRTLLAPGARVLDLMSSLESHLPGDRGLSVVGLGLNAAEMRANPALAEHVVQDLNAELMLPFAQNAFDAVVCSLSMEYLTAPGLVLAEVARVLKPGGTLALAVSNRWFPQKTVRLWTVLHEFERMGYVLDLVSRTRAFADLAATSVRNRDRPKDDKHYQATQIGDPLYLVSGTRV